MKIEIQKPLGSPGLSSTTSSPKAGRVLYPNTNVAKLVAPTVKIAVIASSKDLRSISGISAPRFFNSGI